MFFQKRTLVKLHGTSLISLKTLAFSAPTVVSLDNDDIVDTYDLVNTFNNYFVSKAETTKKSMKYSHKHFSDYLANESGNTICNLLIKKK